MANLSPGETSGGTYFLGRYRVVDEIGIGGMATVHLGRMDGPGGFQKWVAIKRIHPHLVEDESFIQMFLDEARVAARISHPNVAQVYELGKSGDSYWIAMEYLHGEPLREVMRRTDELKQPMPPEIACRIIADAAEGLNAAHELLGKNGEKLNLVHRDVTPHNLFVTYDGTTKVVDFGIAKFSSRMASTRAGTLKGKLAYMSPEQVNGEQIDRRTDIFALGVVLWELTTGQRLFRMDSDLDTLAKVQECNVPRPSTLVRGYPLDLEKIILMALAKHKNERFNTARELSRALQTLLMKRGLFIASDEVSAYTRAIFADRMQKRDAHLRWAAEVTQTISLEAADAVHELSTGSFESYESGEQPPRPAAGAQAPRPGVRPRAGAGPVVPPRPAAGMPVAPAKLADSGETRAAAHAPARPPRPAVISPAPRARVEVKEDAFEEDGPTIARPSPANEEMPTMMGPGANVPMGGALPMAGASVDGLQDFDDDKTIVSGDPTEDGPAAPTPAAGSRPTEPPSAPVQQLRPLQLEPSQPPPMGAPAAFQPMRPGGAPGFPGPSPFQSAPVAPPQAPQQQFQGAPAPYWNGLQAAPAPYWNGPGGAPNPPQQAAPYGTPGASGGFPAPAVPPVRGNQPTVTFPAARRAMPMWLVGAASGVVVLVILSVAYLAFTHARRAAPVPPAVAVSSSGPFVSARASFAAAILPAPEPATGATDTAPPVTTASAPPPATASATATATATTTTKATATAPTAATPRPAPTPTSRPAPLGTRTTTGVRPTPLAPSSPTGLLTVICFPTCSQVYDGVTPLGYPVAKKKVAVGMHRLTLVNGTVRKTISSGIESNKDTIERVDVSK